MPLDIVLRQQDVDDPLSHRFVALGNIDQIGATMRRNDHVRPVAIATDQTVAVLGVLVFADGAVAVVWVDERQIEPARQIERHKTERQVSRQRIGMTSRTGKVSWKTVRIKKAAPQGAAKIPRKPARREDGLAGDDCRPQTRGRDVYSPSVPMA